MRRREFIALLGGATVAWPLAARAQQPTLPVVGFLGQSQTDLSADLLRAFRQGLKETGYVEGQNLVIEYRWAEGHNDRLSAFATDLVRRQVAVIVAITTPSVLAAKEATAAIPIVFFVAGDPVELGLVARLNRPGGNLTGMTTLTLEVASKWLELLHELMPTTSAFAVLINPTSPALAEIQSRDLQAAARNLGMQIHLLEASTDRDFDAAFARLVQLRSGGLVISSDSYFYARSEQLAALARRYAVPAICGFREFAMAGGLMSYGASITDAHRLIGVYTSRVLKGEKPADLPVQQATKIELIINLKTAKALGLTVPLPLLGRADEVIE
jgi:putative tryptophan/tyrosine transport system substrate-binding protein